MPEKKDSKSRPLFIRSQRPQKAYIWSLLNRDVGKYRGPNGYDAGSGSRFQNSKMFLTDQYFGAANCLPVLEKARKANPKGIGFLGDLRATELPPGCMAVVACTKTLMYIKTEKGREAAVERLALSVGPEGGLFVEFASDHLLDVTMETLRKYFADVEVLLANNALTRWFERRFIGGQRQETKQTKLLGTAISLFEYVWHPKPGPHAVAYCRCTKPIDREAPQPLSLGAFPKAGDGIYEIDFGRGERCPGCPICRPGMGR